MRRLLLVVAAVTFTAALWQLAVAHDVIDVLVDGGLCLVAIAFAV